MQKMNEASLHDKKKSILKKSLGSGEGLQLVETGSHKYHAQRAWFNNFLGLLKYFKNFFEDRKQQNLKF